MSILTLEDWIENQLAKSRIIYAKRLSGNDTLANKSHQAGPYLPKEALFGVFPRMREVMDKNGKAALHLFIASHSDQRDAVITWYNNKARDGTRDEARITNLGGASSALLDPEATGSICVFAFDGPRDNFETSAEAWVSRSVVEDDLFEERLGAIDPGKWILLRGGSNEDFLYANSDTRGNCELESNEMPTEWLTRFPSGREIVEWSIRFRSDKNLDVDRRLLRRRECEFEIFQSIERVQYLPVIEAGFRSVPEFVSFANTILQRRKSRGGRSLELQAEQIFVEENLKPGIDFEAMPDKKVDGAPDFVFPSISAYQDSSWPPSKLCILAAKTTFKDRWRQVTKEALRVETKHLLTLQEGVSEKQFAEITASGIVLVVPSGLQDKYPRSVRSSLMSLESFMAHVRLLAI